MVSKTFPVKMELAGCLHIPTFAALPAIQAAPPTAAKNTAAIQACESGSLFVVIAAVIVSAAIPDISAIAIQHW
jgi:hypothetical protein